MNYTIDTEAGVIAIQQDGDVENVPLYSTEGFELLSDLWLKVGWNEKHSYTFTWMGIPVVQLPEDLVRIQELIHRLQPEVIVECGVAHGGGLIFYASLFKAMGKGRVVGVDIEIRPHNRAALEQHPLAGLIALIEGSSVDEAVVARVEAEIGSARDVLVLLDSNHLRDHVLAELEAYHHLVPVGSYIVAMDGAMKYLADTPKGDPAWAQDNPISAAEEFVSRHPEFVIEQPSWSFNESELRTNITHSPSGYLRRIA
ncbi:MAG: class I SAM-dependent methyltransferase [Solirubrobacterales bacterium]|nr:class I SAM-dependent methyltransferase [Solirubrobacterales bacterium]